MYASINIKREDFSKSPETSTTWFIEFHVKYFWLHEDAESNSMSMKIIIYQWA